MQDGIHYNNKGEAVSFVGDGVTLYAAVLLKGHIKLWQKTGMMPTRGFGITKMLARATDYTGQKYKKSQVDQAVADLDAFIITMTAAMPMTQEK